MAVPIRSVEFWINAFIPRDIPGYTMTVPAGRTGYEDDFMSSVGVHTDNIGIFSQPVPAAGNNAAPALAFSDCFLTDQLGSPMT